ncbi:MAG TPA: hypothetical protein VGJ60_15515 [Chloroflexota bacterium]
MRVPVGADEFGGRPSGEPLSTLDPQPFLNFGNELGWRSKCGIPDELEQEVLLQAHARGSGAYLVDVMHGLGHVPNLDSGHLWR